MLMGMMIVVGFIVGFLVGCTGMGGIILIPALVYLSGLSSHVAMGTTLFTFIFTTSLCSWLYIRLGHVDWKATINSIPSWRRRPETRFSSTLSAI